LLSGRLDGERVTRFSFGDESPVQVYDRTAGWKSSAWLLPLLIASLLALLLNALAWPVSSLTRRHYGISNSLTGSEAVAQRWMRIASVATVCVFLGWLTLISVMTAVLDLSSKLHGWVVLLRLLSPFAFIVGAAVGVWGTSVMLRSRRRWYAKLWNAALATSFLVVLWTASVFHLISFRTGY
jgi:hypothetical protein